MKGRTCAGNKGQMTMCKGGWPVLQSSDSRDSTLTGRSVAPISPDSAPHWVFSNHMQGQHMEPGGWEVSPLLRGHGADPGHLGAGSGGMGVVLILILLLGSSTDIICKG